MLPLFQISSQAKVNWIALWACRYNFPIEYFNTSSLIFSIDQKIGMPLRIYKVTTNVAYNRFAQMCIFVDFDKLLLHLIWIDFFN